MENTGSNSLSELVAGGAAAASLALADWTKRRIRLHVRRVEMTPITEACRFLGDPLESIVSVLLPWSGALEGHLLLIFSESESDALMKQLFRARLPQCEPDDEMSRSVLEESANILGSAFLNSIAERLNLDVYPTAPACVRDFAGALLEPVLQGLAMSGSRMIWIDLQFEDDDSEAGEAISGRILLIPSADSLNLLNIRLKAVG